jgi:hypothetical protein
MNWYHCGRCGGLFQSAKTMDDTPACPHCGADPRIGMAEGIAQPAASPPNMPTGLHAASSSPSRGKRTARKRKNPHIMAKLMLGWLLVLGLIILGARKLWHAEPVVSKPVRTAGDATVPSAEDQVLLQNAGPSCGSILQGYLEAGTPETRNQYVWKPVETASRMAHFYSLNPAQNIRVDSLKFSQSGITRLPGGDAYEAVWTSDDGKTLDTVFRKENDEWRLDWEHFIRFSDYPWSLFLAGSGPEEGEFRLLARERLAAERKDEPEISLVLHAPRLGHPAEPGPRSPEFRVSRDTLDGQLLGAAFEMARQGKQVFDSTLPDLNPDRMIRVRVKVKRYEDDGVRKFQITRVIACHWYSVDDPGVEPLLRQSPLEQE